MIQDHAIHRYGLLCAAGYRIQLLYFFIELCVAQGFHSQYSLTDPKLFKSLNNKFNEEQDNRFLHETTAFNYWWNDGENAKETDSKMFAAHIEAYVKLKYLMIACI